MFASIKSLYKSVVNYLSQTVINVIKFASPLLSADKTAREAGRKVGFGGWLKVIAGVAVLVALWVGFMLFFNVMIAVVAAVLGLVFNAFFAQLIAILAVVAFELDVIFSIPAALEVEAA